MNEGRTHVVLSVAEAPQSDVGLGRARIDRESRLALALEIEDVLEIVGKRGTAAKLFRVVQEEEGKGIVQVDSLIRRNLGVSIGDKVEVRKAEVLHAQRVTIAPIVSAGHMISFSEGMESFVKRGLLNRPVTKGDMVIVPGIALMGGALPFMVIKVTPTGIVMISVATVLELRREPTEESPVSKDLSSEAAYERFVRALKRRTEAVLEDFEDTLSGLTGVHKRRAMRLAKSIRKILEDPEGQR